MKINACIVADDDANIDDVVCSIQLESDHEGADVLESEITGYEITDSK